jgi:hypothetical protein
MVRGAWDVLPMLSSNKDSAAVVSDNPLNTEDCFTHQQLGVPHENFKKASKHHQAKTPHALAAGTAIQRNKHM